MAYQVLARKWRPQDFASLIGQEPIVTALTNALSEGRIAQAYLFSGIRGVGKTTAARLLAKSLNCAQGPTATPCNECTPCREITAGADLDVIEVDAATYSKVEQVRELTESLRYGPARDRYKVVVLDEIHRLSRQAFDALLKIVEEPPPHLVFVFATTEAEAVPATVLSRCQEFHFRRVSSRVLGEHLRKLAEAEDIEASDAALHLIARAGEGSVRDSVALLDQLSTFGAGVIADEDAARLVGGLDSRLLLELLAAVLEGRAPVVSEAAGRLEEEGWDPRQAFSQFLTFTRDALRLALAAQASAGRGGEGGGPPRVELPEEDAAALTELAVGAGYENLLRLVQHLLASEAMVRRSDNGYLAVEIAWLRAAELPKLTRVERLLAGGPVTAPTEVSGGQGQKEAARAADHGGASRERSPAEASPTPGPRATGPQAEATQTKATQAKATQTGATQAEAKPGPVAPEAEAAGAGQPAPAAADTARSSGPTEPAPTAPEPRTATRPEQGGSAADAGAEPPRTRQAFLEAIVRHKQPLAAHLEAAELEFSDGALHIRLEPGDDWLPTRLARPDNRRLVDEAVRRTWGEEARWRLEEGEAPARREETAAEAPPDPEVAAASEHPTVQVVLDLFDGQIDGVDKMDSDAESAEEREET